MSAIRDQTFINFAVNILQYDLTPLTHIVIDVAYFIGLCLIIAGLTRLYRHGQGQQMMYRVSPMSTAMYFITGIILISFMPYLQMISVSIFNVNNVLMHNCTISPIGNEAFHTHSNDFCPMLAYSTDIQMAPPGQMVKAAIKYLAFGVLVFVGIISFIRGMIQLIRIGEGSGQGTTGKAFAHIFAGVVAVNADNVYYLAQSILSSASQPT